MAKEEILFLRPIELGRINRPCEIGHEHAIRRDIQGNADSLHQMVEHNLRGFGFRINRCAIHRVAARRVPSVGPIQDAIFEIEFQINRLRQAIEEDFNIAAVGRVLTLRDFDVRAADLSYFSVVRTFLRPVDLPALRIDGDPDAPFLFVVARARIALARIYQSLNLRTVEIRAHDTHPFAIRPIELAVLLIEMELLWREGAAAWNDRLAIVTVEVGALDGSVIQLENTHVGPVDVTRFNVHHDAIGEMAISYDDFFVGTVGIHGEDVVAT